MPPPLTRFKERLNALHEEPSSPSHIGRRLQNLHLIETYLLSILHRTFFKSTVMFSPRTFSPRTFIFPAGVAMTLAATAAKASHQVVFQSSCPSSILQIPGQPNRSQGTYNFDGDVSAAIASGGLSCTQDGVGCPSVEFTLNNGYSTGDITLISRKHCHELSSPNEPLCLPTLPSVTLPFVGHMLAAHLSTSKASFTMLPGGSSATCNDASCGSNQAFFKSDDYVRTSLRPPSSRATLSVRYADLCPCCTFVQGAQRYDSSPNSGIRISFTC